MRPLISRFLDDDSGATAIEYGLIVAMISLAMIAGFSKAADALQFLLGDNASKLQQALQ